MARKDDQLLQTGRSQRSRSGRKSGTPKIIWGAILVCIVGAAFLFRNPGGEIPTGIGENRSVVTTDGEDLLAEYRTPEDAGTPPTAEPQSGEVDLTQYERPLTPETPAGTRPIIADPPASARPGTEPTPSADDRGRTARTEPAAAARTEPAPVPPPAVVPPARRPLGPDLRPETDGPYLVQAGSFGTSENADKEAARLQALGWDTTVRVSNMADGSILYRVRIGYFKTRQDAEAFIRRYPNRLPGAIAVHR